MGVGDEGPSDFFGSGSEKCILTHSSGRHQDANPRTSEAGQKMNRTEYIHSDKVFLAEALLSFLNLSFPCSCLTRRTAFFFVFFPRQGELEYRHNFALLTLPRAVLQSCCAWPPSLLGSELTSSNLLEDHHLFLWTAA